MTIGKGELSIEDLLSPNSNAHRLIPSLSTIKSHNSSVGGFIELLIVIISIRGKLETVSHYIKNKFS